ncbi:MAG: hypothetical protein FJ276_33870 [Planctomycetes bacterium]|nr:hypothetical protein [Planctomycetota bacterium]
MMMKILPSLCLASVLLSVHFNNGVCAEAPRNVSVVFNGETDVAAPLSIGEWHTITARYRYDGRTHLLTNTYMVLAKGGALQSGLDLGYHVPTNQLNIVKHGFWNEMEAAGTPGEAKVIENDQAWLDCESTTVTVTPDGPMFSPEFMAR